MSNNINEISWKREQLWRGCLVASIAHAIMVAHYPELSNEHSWDGMNYSIQDGEGTRATITFHPEFCVSAFRDDSSDRIKAINNVKQAKEYFKGAPQEIVSVGETETLQYLLENVGGKVVPIITTAFWGIGQRLVATDSFEEMYQNGGFLLERQVMEFNKSIESWGEYYDMSSKQCELLKTIFNRKINGGEEEILLSKDDIQLIGTDDTEGLEESRISFKEMGIMWE
jgi:hypothetical protein